MTEDEILNRAAFATYNIAHNEEAHEMFVNVRNALEDMNVTRQELEEFVMTWFAAKSLQDEPEISQEELIHSALAKTASFMLLIDNV